MVPPKKLVSLHLTSFYTNMQWTHTNKAESFVFYFCSSFHFLKTQPPKIRPGSQRGEAVELG